MIYGKEIKMSGLFEQQFTRTRGDILREIGKISETEESINWSEYFSFIVNYSEK